MPKLKAPKFVQDRVAEGETPSVADFDVMGPRRRSGSEPIARDYRKPNKYGR